MKSQNIITNKKIFAYFNNHYLRSTKYCMCTESSTKIDESNQFKGREYECKELKPFSSIPGPKSFPLIGTLWAYLPIIGEYNFKNLYENSVKKYKKYGPIVREEILPGVNLLWLFKAEDIEDLMRAVGNRPERRSHAMIKKYRKSKPDVYNTGGLLPTNGQDWWNIRSKFQKSLGSPLKASIYINATDVIVTEFINKIKEDSFWENNYNKSDFLDYLSRVYIELIYLIAFDARLDAFSPDELKPDSLSSELIKITLNININSAKTDNLTQWVFDYFPTKTHTEMIRGQEKLEKVALNLIHKKLLSIKNKDQKNIFSVEKSLLDTYLHDPDIDWKDIAGMSVDLLLAGIDTTSFSTSYALYNLARNKGVQEKLYKESVELLPNIDDKVTADVLSKAFYLKAFLKESLRFNPISVGIGRTIPRDIILSGYLIPEGTEAVTVNQLCSKRPEYFHNPEEFVPERWLRNSDYPKPTSSFASLPFGHGPRMCIARRLAEQDMYIVLLKLVREFEIGWNGDDLGTISETINRPAGPVSITLKSRNNY